MSGFAVIYHRDGSPVPPADLERMTDRIAHRAPDGIGRWVEGNVGLGHCAHHTLPEDIRQPVHSEDGRQHITFVGRIDNRDDLIPQLHLPAGVADCQVVLGAFRKWGDGCPERLLGDFAFAIWDEPNQRLFCARDILGIAPFYYFLAPDLFIAATERTQLFTHPRVTHAPNEAMVASMLLVDNYSQTETIHQDVQRLAPASCMSVSAAGVTHRRYWHPHEAYQGGVKSPSSEVLWETLLIATKARCRSRSAVGVLLSGGIDSTAVAAAASSHFSRDKSGARVRSYSLVCPDWPEADESALISQTVEKLGLEANYFTPKLRGLGTHVTDVESTDDLPAYPNDSFWDELRTTAAQQGTHVLLTGMGGDEWLSGTDFALADLIRDGQLIQAWERIGKRFSATETGRFGHLLRYGIRPLLPAPFVNLCRRVSRTLRGSTLECPEWLSPEFLARSGLREKMTPVSIETRPRATDHPFLLCYESGATAYARECSDRSNARFLVEARHPLNDRRLIELALSTAGGLRNVDGCKKATFRAATEGKIPESIRTRIGKAEFSRALVQELTRHTDREFFRALELEKRGWVRGSEIRELYENFLADTPEGGYFYGWRLWHLWRIYGFERMARSGRI